VPLVYRQTNYSSAGAGGSSAHVQEEKVRRSAAGGIQRGYLLQVFLTNNRAMPDAVASLRIKMPPGTDPYGIKFELVTAAMTSSSVRNDLPTVMVCGQ